MGEGARRAGEGWMSHAFCSDGAQLESGTYNRPGNLPFRDTLNKERRFLPLQLDDAPIKGARAQRTRVHLRR